MSDEIGEASAAAIDAAAAMTRAVDEACAAMERARAGREPLVPGAISVSIWAIALDALLEANRIDTVRACVPALLDAFPDLEYLQTLTDVFAQLPEQRGAPFADDMAQAVQIVASPGADTVVLAFAGLQNRLMLQVNLIHRWIAAQGVHVVYLRDHRHRLFIEGVAELAPDYAGTIAALERTIAGLGARHVRCLGTCQGGYAALRYAVDLGAERVLGYSPLAHVAPQNVGAVMQRVEKRGWEPATPTELAAIDVKPTLIAASRPPALRIVFGNDNKHDVEQARHLADLPDVVLEPLPDVAGHNSLRASVSARRFDAHLAWLCGQGGAA